MGRKKQSTKSRIVKTAWKLFYKQGYDNTTVDDIIVASNTSKGTFYHYFKGKDGLLGGLALLFDERYEEIDESMDPSISSYEKLFLLNKELFSMIYETVDVNLLASLYSSQLTTKDTKHLLDNQRFYFKLISRIIEEGIADGEFDDSRNSKDLVKIYTMFERGLLYDWALCRGKYNLVEYSSRLLPTVLNSFLHQ